MTITNLITGASRSFLDNPAQNLIYTLLAIPVVYVLVNEVVRKNARLPTLSGPGSWPVVGNIWDIRVNAAEKYREWAKQYGDVYQIMLGNIPVVVVNSATAARAIFGQNAQSLSSRPEFYTFHKVNHQPMQSQLAPC